MVELGGYLICQVFDALVIDTATGSVVAKDELESADIDISQEAKEVIGGRGGNVLATIGGKRNISVKLSEPTFNLQSLADQLGAILKSGAVLADAMPETVEVNSEKKITLKHIPVEDTILFENSKITGVVTSESKEVTVTGANAGDRIKVKTYQYLTPANTKYFDIDAKKFATSKKLVLETPVFDKDEKEVAYLQLVFPKVKSNGAVSLQTKTETEAVSSSVEFTVLSEGGKQGTVRWIPIEDADALAYSVVGDNTIVGNNTIVGGKKK